MTVLVNVTAKNRGGYKDFGEKDLGGGGGGVTDNTVLKRSTFANFFTS